MNKSDRYSNDFQNRPVYDKLKYGCKSTQSNAFMLTYMKKFYRRAISDEMTLCKNLHFLLSKQ